MDFWLSYATLAAIYVLLGLSTNLLVGIAGIFSVSQAAGEEYVPPIPVLEFPLKVGGPPIRWSGTLSSELSPHHATARIVISTDKVAVGDGAVSTIRSDVEIDIDPLNRTPATQRRLSFWFEPGKGLIKRQFGATSAREPAGP